jgi:Ser-tRNA(Ala) deacylase AlaX
MSSETIFVKFHQNHPSFKNEDADRIPANTALKVLHDELQEAYRLLSEELFTDAQTKLTEMKTHFAPLKSWLADCDEFFKFMREKRECFEAEKEMTWDEMEKYEATLAGNQERILEINGQTDRQHCIEFDCQTLKEGGKFDEKLLKRKLKAINKMYRVVLQKM